MALVAGLRLALVCALSWIAAAAAAQTAGEPAAAPAPPRDAAKLESVVEEQVRADAEAKASQERVNALDDETQKLLAEYRKAIADRESYDAYAEQLGAQVRSQSEEIQEIQGKLVEVERTSREVLPLMQRMLDTLAQFVALDVPFLVEERANRVAALRQMMSRADVAISEKYRRIVEAYQVEMDYGRTIEAYEARLGAGDAARTVEFLRVGRVSLLYQTLDGKETGYWDAQKKGWVVDDGYRESFREGVAIAKKLSAPEMLVVPVPAPQDAKS